MNEIIKILPVETLCAILKDMIRLKIIHYEKLNARSAPEIVGWKDGCESLCNEIDLEIRKRLNNSYVNIEYIIYENKNKT